MNSKIKSNLQFIIIVFLLLVIISLNIYQIAYIKIEIKSFKTNISSTIKENEKKINDLDSRLGEKRGIRKFGNYSIEREIENLDSKIEDLDSRISELETR